MKNLLILFMVSGALSLPVAAFSAVPASLVILSQEENVEHGGGCRKSSPAGMCCHMNRKTGEVHCH